MSRRLFLVLLFAVCLLCAGLNLSPPGAKAAAQQAAKSSAVETPAQPAEQPKAAGELAEKHEGDEADEDDEDGFMSEEDVKKLFEAADANKDGNLTWQELLQNAKDGHQKEFDAFSKEHDPEEQAPVWDATTEADLRELFDSVDTNKDSIVSLEELERLSEGDEGEEDEDDENEVGPVSLLEVEQESEEDSDDEEEEGFSPNDDKQATMLKVDSNRDGRLSLEELKTHMTTDTAAELHDRFGFEDDDLEETFEIADANHDGGLDFTELLEMDERIDLAKGVSHEQEDEEEDEEASLLEDKGDHGDEGMAELSDAELAETFKLVDSDGNGKVTWAEVQPKLGQAANSLVEEDFHVSDSDKDGSLDAKDFHKFAHTFVQRVGSGAFDVFPSLLSLGAVQH